jgi:hypothetical protein
MPAGFIIELQTSKYIWFIPPTVSEATVTVPATAGFIPPSLSVQVIIGAGKGGQFREVCGSFAVVPQLFES